MKTKSNNPGLVLAICSHCNAALCKALPGEVIKCAICKKEYTVKDPEPKPLKGR